MHPSSPVGGSGAPSSTSSTYSHLSSSTPGTSLSSLPRHLANNSTPSFGYRSPDGMAFMRGTPELRPPSSLAHAPRAIAGTNANATMGRTPSMPSLPSMAALPASQPFVPTVNFDALADRHARGSHSPSSSTSSSSSSLPSLLHAPSSSTSRPSSPFVLPASPVSRMAFDRDAGAPTFQPDFLLPGIHASNTTPTNESRESSMNKMSKFDDSPTAHHQSVLPLGLSPSQSTPSFSKRSIRICVDRQSTGGGVVPSAIGTPGQVLRSRFAHLNASHNIVSTAPPLVARRMIGREFETTNDLDDPVCTFETVDASPTHVAAIASAASMSRSPSYSYDSSPLQAVRRLGGARQLQASRRSTGVTPLSPLSRSSSIAASPTAAAGATPFGATFGFPSFPDTPAAAAAANGGMTTDSPATAIRSLAISTGAR